MEEIIRLYNNGKSVKEISFLTEIPISTVYYNLHKNGILLGKPGPKSKVDENIILEKYKSGLTCVKISKQINLSHSVIYRILKTKFPMDLRNRSEAVRNKDIKHSFFKSYDFMSCYWAGFIAADGNIQKSGKKQSNLITINLRKSDASHLINFGNLLNYRKVKINNISSIRFSSKEMALDLTNNFNIVPNKSLILKPPIKIPDLFIPSFIRGYFDGDGWICNKTQYGIGLLGTKEMLEWIRGNICYNCGANFNKVFKINNIHELSWRGRKQTVNILEWIYKDSMPETRLERKYEIFLNKYL